MAMINFNKTKQPGFMRAMRLTPGVRKDEYLKLLEPLDCRQNMQLLDIGSGGNFLNQYLGSIAEVHQHAFAPPFSGKALRNISKLKILLPASTVDVIVCLAVTHQLNPQQRLVLWRECYRVLKPGGKMIINLRSA